MSHDPHLIITMAGIAITKQWGHLTLHFMRETEVLVPFAITTRGLSVVECQALSSAYHSYVC